jgi:phosphoglycerol geranylgeranyltransferase
VKGSVYDIIVKNKKKGVKLFSVLIDPDKFSSEVIKEADAAKVDFILIGGSKVKKGSFHRCVNSIRKISNIPLVIFPGGKEQVSEKADAILLLSLISGRNPDYLIGEHIHAARRLKKSGLEIIPTGYLLIGEGKKASVHSVSRTLPIKNSDKKLAVATAIAGELLGMKIIYLEGGSGTKTPLHSSLVREVRKNIAVPLIAGGGIDSPEKGLALLKAGADMIVVGNAIEKDITLVYKIANAIRSMR